MPHTLCDSTSVIPLPVEMDKNCIVEMDKNCIVRDWKITVEGEAPWYYFW
jgi:hypothetical protein